MTANMYQFLILISINLIIFITSIIIFIKVRKSKKDIVKIDSDQFVTSVRVFEQIIATYKNIYYNKEIEKLIYSYDLNKDSSTNSHEQFEVAKNLLITKSAKEILENLISEDIRKTLSIYFNDESLILLIIEKLEEKG